MVCGCISVDAIGSLNIQNIQMTLIGCRSNLKYLYFTLLCVRCPSGPSAMLRFLQTSHNILSVILFYPTELTGNAFHKYLANVLLTLEGQRVDCCYHYGSEAFIHMFNKLQHKIRQEFNLYVDVHFNRIKVFNAF